MSRTLIICVGLLLTTVTLKAQQPTPSPDLSTRPKQISGGVLNGKALSLPKPRYPAEARTVGASGAVTVQVLIDENGDVVSATAVSGHPLLRAAAVEAAKGAKFSPTLLEGSPVKVSGVITYNFVSAMTPAGLGFTVALAERTGNFVRHTPPASLASQLPADWTEEKEILNSLTYEERVVEEKPVSKAVPPPAKIEQKESDKQRYTLKGDINFSAASIGPTKKLDAKSIAAVANLRSMFEQRMSVDERAAWNYEIGTALGALLAEYDDASARRSNVAKIESLVAIPPTDASQAAIQSLKEFLESAKTAAGDDTFDMKARIEQLANLRY